ncbi:LysR family transcriptional regulator [Shewanella gelidii]|uniref:LysR family transcriptional regulator n=1 Tax=Shewanella gelidii TaxID=1642821 RepID=A0A917NAE6_9GAMM|nr:LysR family transcriptional regulator [Shewanella gelidii]MCL1099131.1 LysR family transcriptional regulator [Shewanella gelidii]GGI81488.1 LysR family transcriptional regulator [Shewanella gelidii]
MDAGQLYRMLIFATVVEEGSLTAAAESLSISRSMVSQHLKKLEQRLACKLLQRTTRKMALTAEGQDFYHHCAELLQLAKQAETLTKPQDAELRGSIRVSAPVAIGEHFLIPLIKQFNVEFPNIRLSITLEDRKLNIREQHIDLAIQAGKMDEDDPSTISLGTYEEYLVASAGYIEAHGAPLHPDSLKHHQWLMLANNHLPQNCDIQNTYGEVFKVRVTPFVSCNHYPSLLDLTTQGLGIAILPNYMVQAALSDHELTRLLPDCHLKQGSVYAIHPFEESIPPRVRVFIDYLSKSLSFFKNVPTPEKSD